MNFNYFLAFNFFAPRDTKNYPPCGMFTLGHFLLLFVFIALLVLAFYLARNLTEKQIYKQLKVVSILVVILEGIKIGYNFYYGYTYLDAWLPLTFCSLFIYASLMSAYGKGFIKKLGDNFIFGGCVLAGGFFLLFPTTSLMNHPVYHYLCLYSMLYHSFMFYFGLQFLMKNIVTLNKESLFYYLGFTLGFEVIAIIVNKIYGCNMMFLSNPYRIPVPFLNVINEHLPWLYTIIVILSYSVLYFFPYIYTKIANHNKKKNNEAIA